MTASEMTLFLKKGKIAVKKKKSSDSCNAITVAGTGLCFVFQKSCG
jgi:hypothetical protein